VTIDDVRELLGTEAPTDDGLLDLMRELAGLKRGEPWARSLDGPPLYGSAYDQPVPDGVENPYWEIVRLLPTTPRWYGEGSVGDPNGWWTVNLPDGARTRAAAAGLDRGDLCVRYSWAIPSPGDVAWICNELAGQGVVEIGAGGGYWAWQLAQVGIDVTAYDPHAPGPNNNFARHRLYHPVQSGDHEKAAGHPDRALMLCWPSYCDPFAKQALHHYRGDTVIYIGESAGGCCADDRFHRILRRDFEHAGSSPKHVTYWGIHCDLSIWRRKAPGAQAGDDAA
jgi:hypothetical protein